MSRTLSFLLFLAIALSLVAGMHYYVWARLVRDPQLPQGWARVGTGALVALAIALPLALWLSRVAPGVRPLLWLAFVWMGVGFLLVAFLGIADAGRLAAWAVRRLGGPETPADPQKRVLLARTVAAGVGGVVAGLSAFGVRSALGAVDVKALTVRLRGLPQTLAGFKLVQISDVHVGPLLRKEWLRGVVAQISSLAPDAVVITGDLVDGSVAELREHVEPLGELKPPRGVFFSTGNHEYYSGVAQWMAHLPTLGIQPLSNRHVELAPGLDLAGIDDPSGEPDLALALEGRDGRKPVILLAHQPRQFAEAVRREVDLTLSGHTHGGQIWPFSWVVALTQPYLAGLHVRGGSQLYVSRGTGFWGPPLRVFAPAEITLLTLQPA